MLLTALRLLFSLAVVLGLLVFAARALRARGAGGLFRPGAASVQVVTRHSLTRSASLAVVRVGDAVLLLGVTEQSVQVLRELDEDALAGDGPAAPPAGPVTPAQRPDQWRALVEVLRERTTRRG